MPPCSAHDCGQPAYRFKESSCDGAVCEPNLGPAGLRYLKRGIDAEIALISRTSKNGVAVTGFYDVLGLQPDNAGQWAIIPMGFWAPTSQFEQCLPSLLKVAESYQINEAWVKEYVWQGQERVREMLKKTSSMMSRYAKEMRQASYISHQKRMRSGDFISYKFSTSMRGEQEWVTSLNGGRDREDGSLGP